MSISPYPDTVLLDLSTRNLVEYLDTNSKTIDWNIYIDIYNENIEVYIYSQMSADSLGYSQYISRYDNDAIIVTSVSSLNWKRNYYWKDAIVVKVAAKGEYKFNGNNSTYDPRNSYLLSSYLYRHKIDII